MVRFFDTLNTPQAVAVALAFVLFIDGFLFYRYQQKLEGNNVTSPIIDARVAAAEEPIASLDPEPEIFEEPTARVEEREPASEAEITVPAEPAAAAAAAPAPKVGEGAVRVVVGVSGAPSWLRVQEDRKVVHDQLSNPDFTREFVADRAISVQAGNAGAVQVEVDGRDVGALGADGEAAERTYTTQKR